MTAKGHGGSLVALSLQLEFRLIGWLVLAVMFAVVCRWWKNHEYRPIWREELMVCIAAIAAGSTFGDGIWSSSSRRRPLLRMGLFRRVRPGRLICVVLPSPRFRKSFP